MSMAGGGNSWAQTKAAYATMGVAGRVAFVAGVAGAAILGVSLFNFGRSVIGPGVSAAASVKDQKDMTAAHEAEFERYLAQWNGRSLIIKPGSPKPAEPLKVEAESGPPAPPPPPATYGGPAIIAMVLDTVWFDDGKRMTVGDEAKDELEVIQVLAPWDAVVKWKGVEFTVPLFARDKLVQVPDEKPVEPPKETKPTEQAGPPDPGSTGSPGGANGGSPGTPKPDAAKAEPTKVAEKTEPKPEKPPEPKQDAAPGTPAETAPPGEAPDTQSKETDRPPEGRDGGWR
jgi:hypothetical protein